MSQVFINSGHHNLDSGVIVGSLVERDINKQIRDEVRKLLPNAFFVPDNLNLKESIEWINAQAEGGDVALDLHCNSINDSRVRGVECYYFKNYELAKTVSNSISQETGIPNRGPKRDSDSWLGSLGFVRNLKCQSIVVECGYLTNTLDAHILTTNQQAIARGIYNALIVPDRERLIRQKITLLTRLIELYKQLILMLKK